MTLTHKIHNELFGFEVFLHLHPYTVNLQFFQHVVLLFQVLDIPQRLGNLLLR